MIIQEVNKKKAFFKKSVKVEGALTGKHGHREFRMQL